MFPSLGEIQERRYEELMRQSWEAQQQEEKQRMMQTEDGRVEPERAADVLPDGTLRVAVGDGRYKFVLEGEEEEEGEGGGQRNTETEMRAVNMPMAKSKRHGQQWGQQGQREWEERGGWQRDREGHGGHRNKERQGGKWNGGSEYKEKIAFGVESQDRNRMGDRNTQGEEEEKEEVKQRWKVKAEKEEEEENQRRMGLLPVLQGTPKVSRLEWLMQGKIE